MSGQEKALGKLPASIAGLFYDKRREAKGRIRGRHNKEHSKVA
jgi:hypothetical protein